jgi:hypothetical protein
MPAPRPRPTQPSAPSFFHYGLVRNVRIRLCFGKDCSSDSDFGAADQGPN